MQRLKRPNAAPACADNYHKRFHVHKRARPQAEVTHPRGATKQLVAVNTHLGKPGGHLLPMPNASAAAHATTPKSL
jgi:hypothetical protein